MKLRKMIASALVLMLGLVLVPVTFAQETAQVRVVHASPDAPSVDVYVDGNRVLSGVEFFTASDYLDLSPGEHRFQVTPAGEAADAAVIDTTATLEAGTAYTVAATGLLEDISASINVDDLSAPADGQAKVKVYHFSPDAPAVDVKVQGGDTLISSLAFPDGSDYLEVPAGTYDLVVTPAGADDVVLDLSGTALAAGNIYSVFATNVLASITPEVSVTTPAGDAAPAPEEETAAPETPATLPATADGTTLSLAALLIGALLVFGAGALVVRRITS